LIKELGEPKVFWEYFLQITKIPRCSENEDKIREFIQKEAEVFGYETFTDDANNLLVNIPSKIQKKDNKTVILQSHLDIVCEKNEGIEHNFSKDPLKLEINEINKNKWLTATGTTLGADNGVGIAYSLTLMKLISLGKLSFDNIILKLLFTVNEEGGLVGAFNIRKDFVNGDYLINLDSEEDDRFTIGCAGGITTHGYIDLEFINVGKTIHKPIKHKLIIKGLQGGHSGVDINKERANAIKILVKILWRLNNEYPLEIQSLKGGNLHNAIPREAKCIFYSEKEHSEKIQKKKKEIKKEIIHQYKNNEPELDITFEERTEKPNDKVFISRIKNDLLNILYAIPHGPIKYHPNNPDLVHTSTNLAAVKVNDNKMEILTSQRSLENVTRRELYERIEALFKLSSLDIKIEYTQKYPGWSPNFDSKLLKIAKNSYKTLFDKEPIIQTIHAGLECGIIKESLQATEMISLGPEIKDAHSPDERLNIKSTHKIWKLLKKILKTI
jgi:dipeptidase D